MSESFNLLKIPDYDIFRFWKILTFSDTDIFRYWRILTSSDSDIFRLIKILTSSDFDIFRFIKILTFSSGAIFWSNLFLTFSSFEGFWHFQILTFSGLEGFWHFQILTFSDSDIFRIWHKMDSDITSLPLFRCTSLEIACLGWRLAKAVYLICSIFSLSSFKQSQAVYRGGVIVYPVTQAYGNLALEDHWRFVVGHRY